MKPFEPLAVDSPIKAGLLTHNPQPPVPLNFRLETGTTAATHWATPDVVFNAGDFGVNLVQAKWMEFVIPLTEFKNNAGASLSDQASINIVGWRLQSPTGGNYWIGPIAALGSW